MAQTVDPRQGFNRSKKLLNKVAAKAMARKGYKSRLGLFSRMSTQHNQMGRNLRPFSRPGNANKGGARPQGYGDFFDGLGQGQGGGRSQQEGYINTAPVQAALPDNYWDSVSQPEDDAPSFAPAPGGAAPGSAYDPTQTYAAPDGMDYYSQGGTSQDPNVANAYNWGASFAESPEGQSELESMSQLFGTDGQPLQQSAPSSPITAPGGLIPLGGGRYYDPATDTIHGGGGGRMMAV